MIEAKKMQGWHEGYNDEKAAKGNPGKGGNPNEGEPGEGGGQEQANASGGEWLEELAEEYPDLRDLAEEAEEAAEIADTAAMRTACEELCDFLSTSVEPAYPEISDEQCSQICDQVEAGIMEMHQLPGGYLQGIGQAVESVIDPEAHAQWIESRKGAGPGEGDAGEKKGPKEPNEGSDSANPVPPA